MRFASCGLVAVAVAVAVFASSRWTLQAQDRSARSQVKGRGDKENPAVRSAATSVQDALLKPFDLPFGEETTLEEVRQHLGKALGGQVVLDRSALDRLELTPEDTVQLDLKGVRLKVGLKLLLDQVGLSYRVVPEDNLLILTDPEGSDDPGQRVLAELKAMHRELHDLQDAVDDLRDLVEEDLGFEADPPKQGATLVQRTRVKAPRRPLKPVSTRPKPGVGG
jgi:hypothetical protein